MQSLFFLFGGGIWLSFFFFFFLRGGAIWLTTRYCLVNNHSPTCATYNHNPKPGQQESSPFMAEEVLGAQMGRSCWPVCQSPGGLYRSVGFGCLSVLTRVWTWKEKQKWSTMGKPPVWGPWEGPETVRNIPCQPPTEDSCDPKRRGHRGEKVALLLVDGANINFYIRGLGLQLREGGCNVGPPLLALVAIVENFFLIQNPVTVLTVRYCGKFFAPPRKI